MFASLLEACFHTLYSCLCKFISKKGTCLVSHIRLNLLQCYYQQLNWKYAYPSFPFARIMK